MQLPQNKNRQTSDQLRTARKAKFSPINPLKYKKYSEITKNKNQSPTKKPQLKTTPNYNNLQLDKIMLCGGMKLNTRLNISVDKRKKAVGPLKTIRGNPQKIELGTSTIQNYFDHFLPSTSLLPKKSKIMQYPLQLKISLQLPLIDNTDIIISKQSYTNNNDHFYAFSQHRKCYVSLYQSQHDHQLLINHPNILPAYGMYIHNQRKYFVTNIFQGLTLRSLVAQFGSLPQITTKIFVRQLLEGLSKIHSLQLAHNRLNMESVLHDKMGTLLINFFKSSKLPLSESQKNQHLYFFPPQTLLSRNYYDSPKSDIWAVGCIVLQMLIPKSIKLNKYHPYNRNIANKDMTDSIIIIQKVQKIIQQKYTIKDNHNNAQSDFPISALALQFVSKCLSITIQNRPSINEMLTHPFISEFCFALMQQ